MRSNVANCNKALIIINHFIFSEIVMQIFSELNKYFNANHKNPLTLTGLLTHMHSKCDCGTVLLLITA